MTKAKVRLLSAHFDYEGAEVSYTTPEVGGAASLKNEAYMFKSMQEQTVEQATNESLPSDNIGVNHENTNEDNTLEQQEMIKQLQDKIAAMELEKAVSNAVLSFQKVLGNEEVVAELASTFNTKEQVEVIVKALEAVKAEKEEAITKAQEEQESELQKALKEEVGHQEKQEEAAAPMTVVEKALQLKKGEK